MLLMPVSSAFLIALVGGLAVGLRSGYPFLPILVGATLVAAMTALASSVLQFLPQRFYMAGAVLTGVAVGMVVWPMLEFAEVMGLGPVRGPLLGVWPVAAVSSLLLSRSWGMRMPHVRHRPRHVGR